AAPGAGDDDDAAIAVGGKTLQRLLEPRGHLARQRVEPLRPVKGQGGDAVFGTFEQVGHGALLRAIADHSRVELVIARSAATKQCRAKCAWRREIASRSLSSGGAERRPGGSR